MTLIKMQPRLPRFAPWADLDTMQQRLQRMFGEPTLGMVQTLGWVPAVDVSETPKELVVTAELPGMEAADVDVAIDRDVLTLRGEKKEEKETKDAERHLWERTYGAFERSFTLPCAVDAPAAKAEFVKGVLTVHLPKAKEEIAKGHKIPIAQK